MNHSSFYSIRHLVQALIDQLSPRFLQDHRYERNLFFFKLIFLK